ncbi:MAG: response regulator [Pyrinomonadaceae bacterium]
MSPASVSTALGANMCPALLSDYLFADEVEDRASEFSYAEGGPQADRDKPCALVVDDVQDVTEMLATFLRHAGYNVVTADSAFEALRAARGQRFDVIVSDIGMPEMNGYELAEAVRTLPDYYGVPMIAVTGFTMYDDRERAIQSGFNAHLTKPINPMTLLELIERLRD